MKKMPSWLLLLAALGFPTTVVALFPNFVSQHPVVAIGCMLLYEVGIIVIGVVGKIWQQLESNWVKQIANFIDLKMQILFSQYYRRYRRYMNDFHRYIDLKGLGIQGPYNPELEQVFIDLSVVSIPSQLSGADPLQKWKKEGKSIWYYLTSRIFLKENLVIIGPPGSGKTTLLKYVALTLINRNKIAKVKIPDKLPILLLLRDHGDAIKKKPDFSLVDAIQDQLRKWNEDVALVWVKQKLAKGHCLILLDGLDEVADSALRMKVVDWVQQQMVKYGKDGKNRFVITSRPYGYSSNSLTGPSVLSINSFNDHKIREFVHKWYIFNEIRSLQRDDQGVRMRARSEAEELLRRLRDHPNLLALTVNPLLLTMIVLVHRYRGILPGSRVDLYREICEVFLGKRHLAKGLRLELSVDKQLRVLQPLAYFMMSSEIKDISLSQAGKVIIEPLKRVSRQMQPENFLLFIENNSGLLVEREQGIYSFAHSSFQEYLAAVYLHEEKLGEELATKVEMSWWHETVRLYCALTDATPIIRACLAKNPPSTLTLALALDCQKEAREVQPEVNDQLDALLDQDMDDNDPERRHIVAEALLARRLQRMIYVKQGKYIDRSLVTCAEYQIFIDAQSVEGNFRQPDHWTESYFERYRGGTPILGIRASDAIAFCQWLTNREPSEWIYRIPQSDEVLEKVVGGEEMEVDEQMEGLAYWINGGRGFAGIKEFLLTLDKIRENLDLRKTLNFDLNSARDRANLLDKVLSPRPKESLAQDLGRVHSHAQKIAQHLDKMDELESICLEDLDRAYNRARALSYTLDLDRAFIRAQELAKSPKRRMPIPRVSYEDLTITHTLDLDLMHALEIARSRKLSAIPREYNKRELINFLIEYINLSALTLAIHLSYLKRQGTRRPNFLSNLRKRLFRDKSDRRQDDDDVVQQMIDIYYDVYVTSVLLEKRIAGELQAFEGILIMKELKEDNN